MVTFSRRFGVAAGGRPRLQAPADAGAASAWGSLPTLPRAPAMLDAEALARLAELDPSGDSRLIERVLQAFEVSVARLRPQLDAARRDGDRRAIRLVAHTLKSSSASIGALRLSQLCAQLEAAAQSPGGENLDAPLAAFDDALDDALDAIAVRMKGHG
jgi:HPt (histidine-containing phosphotransfer) domain-containing protein